MQVLFPPFPSRGRASRGYTSLTGFRLRVDRGPRTKEFSVTPSVEWLHRAVQGADIHPKYIPEFSGFEGRKDPTFLGTVVRQFDICGAPYPRSQVFRIFPASSSNSSSSSFRSSKRVNCKARASFVFPESR